MPTTTGMLGGGFYDANSLAQRRAFEPFLPWLEKALEKLPLPADIQWPVTFLDIGSSEGGNAIYALNRLIGCVRQRSSHPVWAVLSDLPTNDFNHLFQNLAGGGFKVPGVYPAAVGGTAFGRLAPARSVHVATTFNAIGFLDKRPEAPLPNYILPMGPSQRMEETVASVTAAEMAPFAEQAALDLANFYHARAAELVTGGKLLVQVFGRSDTVRACDGLYDVLSDALLDCVSEGILTREYYRDLIFPIYFRSAEELVAPIESDTHLAEYFRVEKVEAKEAPVPFNEELKSSGDREAWATSYCGFLRAFSERIITAALPAAADHQQIADRIYQHVTERMRAEPERYEFRFISVGALLTRK